MRLVDLAVLFLSISHRCNAAEQKYTTLIPLPRRAWDHSVQVESTLAKNVALQTKEQFMWAYGHYPNATQTVASVVIYAKQDERIIDLDKFAYALRPLRCTSTSIKLRFWLPSFYQAAKDAWQWVNYSKLRSFAIVVTGHGCSSPNTREPWLVSDAAFEDYPETITLRATKTTWKSITETYVLDFGEFDTDRNHRDKRFLDVDLNKVFTLDLTASLPTEIAHWNVSNKFVNASLAINCTDCGTRGTLTFAGHIEASITGVKKFELSATPRGIEAKVDVALIFQGEVDFEGLPAVGRQWTLVTLPLPAGWKIPGLFLFGPTVRINAGYGIDYIGGEAIVTTGISARVPDSSVARVDIASRSPVTISGWIPEIETRPLSVQAQIDAKAHLYTEIAVAASIEVLGEAGITVEVGIEIPEITVTASAGYKESGFCPSEPTKPWGLTLDATLGASLALEGYTQTGSEKHVFLDVTLYRAPVLYTFPQLCLSFGDISPGACIAVVGPQDPDDGYNEPGAYPPPPPTRKRQIKMIDSVPEDDASKSPRRFFFVRCDQRREHAIFLQKYPSPQTLKKDPNVPIMQPLMACASADCPPSTWDVQVAMDPSAVSGKNWASEHIYEGNWIQAYLNYLKDKYYTTPGPGSNDTQCNGEMDTFGVQRDIATPNPTPALNYSEALMQNLGTVYTASRLMALFPQKQNHLKYLMFAGSNIDAQFTSAVSNGSPNTHEKRVCSIGRIITVCKYMDHDRIISGLNDTITAIESVLEKMDADNVIYKPDELRQKTFKTAHAEFFQELYQKGFTNARDRLKQYATWLKSQPDFNTLSAEKRQGVEAVAENPAQFCVGRFRR